MGERHAGFIVEQAPPGSGAGSGAVPFSAVSVRPDDVLVYHAAHASPLGAWLAGIDAVKVVDFHGITPPEFLRGWDAGLAVALARGHDELAALGPQAALGIAHSSCTAGDLTRAGFARTAVLPVLMDPARLATPSDPATLARLQAGNRGHDLLFVSRMAPNKRIEDLLKLLAVYRGAWHPEARLLLVGRPDVAAYDRALRTFAERLGSGGVVFAGPVSVAELMAYYAAADLFVSMSEHEGFGIPAVEAMALGLPVLAYAAAAVPEVTAGAAVLFGDKCSEEVAALADAVLGDAPLLDRLRATGHRRAAELAAQQVAPAYLAALGAL